MSTQKYCFFIYKNFFCKACIYDILIFYSSKDVVKTLLWRVIALNDRRTEHGKVTFPLEEKIVQRSVIKV